MSAVAPQAPRDATALDQADRLDVHFAACQPEYEALLRAVGIRPGWRVLDADCGGGSYLSLLAQLPGPTGPTTALDLDPENVAAIRDRLAAQPLPCPVAPRGFLAALPYPNGAFDPVRCAKFGSVGGRVMRTACRCDWRASRAPRPPGRSRLQVGGVLGDARDHRLGDVPAAHDDHAAVRPRDHTE